MGWIITPYQCLTPSCILCWPCHAIKNQNQIYSVQKVQNLGHERRKIWKKARQETDLWDISYVRYSKNVLPKLIKLCMETPCWCHFEGPKYGGRKTTETSVFEVFHKSRNFKIAWGTQKHESNIYFEARNVKIRQCQKTGNFLAYMAAFPLAKCRVTRKLWNSSVLYRKMKNHFEPKIYMGKGVKPLYDRLKLNTHQNGQFFSLNFGDVKWKPRILKQQHRCRPSAIES